ncbi:uncharacterized protein C8A04DRAFT_38121 [Dichotomopilus funicola]|uniref:Uncharacterized protein n=1 Tax=Dichotomopilus funicola TaxID=1934379 RepID=A0AAN6V123_9PEZI|nr:hypothetical protein C8A04DRAFT_38121 [Dichotomopilus funicola]
MLSSTCCVVALLVAPLTAVATRTRQLGYVAVRQANGAPTPCVRIDPPPSQEETVARFNAFVDAFVGPSKSLFEAFKYIAEDYINHNPAAQNGSQSAWDILSPFWDSSSITYIRSTVAEDMSWVNYKSGGFGEVVDRFRWEAGCIAEHWDQGEEYPAV